VLLRRDAFADHDSAASSLYLDLQRNQEAQRRGVPLFTPAVQSMYALREALAELEQTGGWQGRRDRYREVSARIRQALRSQGVELLLTDPQVYSSMLTSFRLPDEVTFDELFQHLKQSGFVIYPGQQSLSEVIFRVAVMGALDDDDVDELLDRFSQFFLAADPI
jgi:2-aminoethylphosphonate-pyruvate transaminase